MKCFLTINNKEGKETRVKVFSSNESKGIKEWEVN